MCAKIMNNLEAIDEQKLDALENTLQSRLPEDYRNFLLEYNGGVPIPSDFLIADGLGYGNVAELFGLYEELNTSNLLWYLSLKDEYFPHSLLRIGDDPGGNYICISLTWDDKGNIYYWNYEMGLHSQELGYKNPFLLAYSFSDFLNKLFDASKSVD